MQMTPQERLALTVVVLLLVAGAVARFTGQEPGVEWVEEAHASSVTAEAGGAARLGEQVQQEVVRSRRRAMPLAEGERIDPNTADADELQRLPRIGPALAARIVAHREQHGAFRTLADLDAVSGIGPALLAGVAPHVALPPAPPPKPVAAAAAPNPARTAGTTMPSTPRSTVDINTATAEELTQLPGIGPVLAARIVEWRTAHGRFRTVDDLQAVSGIGPRTIERLAALARVGS